MNPTAIEYAHATWNPVVGCSPVSDGCRNCYAARWAGTRLAHLPIYRGIATREGRWTGAVRFLKERLDEPPTWARRRPTLVFVGSMADIFHGTITDIERHRIFEALSPESLSHHRFAFLTKRADQMFRTVGFWNERVAEYHGRVTRTGARYLYTWELPFWFGVTVENDRVAFRRLRYLGNTPARVRWVSIEPILSHLVDALVPFRSRIDWIVIGMETGPNARPVPIRYVEAVVEWAQEKRIPVFVKRITDPRGRVLPIEEWPESIRVREYPDDLRRAA